MAPSSLDLRARLDRPEPFLFSWMSLPGAAHASLVAGLPFDGVCLDLQHGRIGYSEAAAMIAAIAAAGRPAIVRPLWNEPGPIGQVLDAGAAAVIVPMVNSRREAESLVAAAKFPPLGQRSWGPHGALLSTGLDSQTYFRHANRMTLAFAMIETREGLAAVDEIAATPGLDGLFVGPSDLSIALSNGAGIDKTGPETRAAMTKIATAAARHGLVAGAFAGSPDVAKLYLDMGYRFVSVTSDIDLMKAGAAAVVKQLRPVIASAD